MQRWDGERVRGPGNTSVRNLLADEMYPGGAILFRKHQVWAGQGRRYNRRGELLRMNMFHRMFIFFSLFVSFISFIVLLSLLSLLSFSLSFPLGVAMLS